MIKALEGPSPPFVFHLSVTDHIFTGERNTRHAPITQSTMPAIISCVISLLVWLSEFKEIKVRPAGILSIEMLLSTQLQAEGLVDSVGGLVRGERIETDGLHAICLSKTDSLKNHLRADAFTLPVRTDGKNMNHGHFIVTHLPRPFYRVIVLALIHRDSHRPDDAAILTI